MPEELNNIGKLLDKHDEQGIALLLQRLERYRRRGCKIKGVIESTCG